MWQRLKNVGLVTGPSGLFATRRVTESGGLATNPPCDKPIEDYSTLYRSMQQGFVTEGSRQRYVTGGGEPRQPPYFEAQPCIYIYMYIYIYTYIYIIYVYTRTLRPHGAFGLLHSLRPSLFPGRWLPIPPDTCEVIQLCQGSGAKRMIARQG